MRCLFGVWIRTACTTTARSGVSSPLWDLQSGDRVRWEIQDGSTPNSMLMGVTELRRMAEKTLNFQILEKSSLLIPTTRLCSNSLTFLQMVLVSLLKTSSRRLAIACSITRQYSGYAWASCCFSSCSWLFSGSRRGAKTLHLLDPATELL